MTPVEQIVRIDLLDEYWGNPPVQTWEDSPWLSSLQWITTTDMPNEKLFSGSMSLRLHFENGTHYDIDPDTYYEASYWVLLLSYDGQTDPLYAALSQMNFDPGPLRRLSRFTKNEAPIASCMSVLDRHVRACGPHHSIIDRRTYKAVKQTFGPRAGDLARQWIRRFDGDGRYYIFYGRTHWTNP